MHPEVIKYIQRNTSKAGKARWAKIKKEDRHKQLLKTHEGLKRYWKEYRERKWKEQFRED